MPNFTFAGFVIFFFFWDPGDFILQLSQASRNLSELSSFSPHYSGMQLDYGSLLPKKVSEENDKKDYHYRSSWGYEIKQRDSNGGRKDTVGRSLIW